MDTWLGGIGATMKLNSAGEKELYLPVTGRRYLLTERDCSNLEKPSSLKVQPGRNIALFVMVSEL